MAERVKHLFAVIRSKKTGEPYTNAEIVRMSLGELTEEEIEDLQVASQTNPRMSKVVALADAFGIHPSYFFARVKEPFFIDQEVLDILQDTTVSAIARKSLRLTYREKQAILEIIRQFEGLREIDSDDGM